jgi:hypothetical protein
MLKIKELSMKGGHRYLTLVALLLVTMISMAADLTWTFKFSPSDIVLSPSGTYTYVTLKDGAKVRDAIGAPAIPAKFANILLPDGATDVTVTATGELVRLASDVTPWPTQRATPKSKEKAPFVEPDPVAYASSSPWPAVAATNEGLHEMQGSSFVSVRVNPIVYVASEKALYYRPSVTVTVTYNAPAAPRGASQNARVTDMVNALVVNPVSSVVPRKGRRDTAADAVDYLIITSNSLKSAFQALADYRTTGPGGNYNTLVVTKEEINSNYEGTDTQMKIRNCIIDYYNNHGTTFVVLGGDDTIVPDRDTYVSVGYDTESNMPTDLYYSDLTGTWKKSGSSSYGVVGANFDMTPEVIVGRIPIRTAAQLNGYIAKLQAFEASPTHTRNSIIMGGPSAWDTYSGNNRPSDNVTGDGHAGFRASNHPTVSDSEMWLRRLYRDGIKPYWDNVEEAGSRTINLATDCITSWDGSTCGDKPLSGANLKTWLNNGYTHLMFSGHGSPQSWGMETYDDYDSNKAAAQTNLTAIVYTDACLTGHFDGTSWSGYTTEPCLGEAFIRNANGGALAYMGCARYGWGDPDDGAASNTSDGGPSTVYAYKFYHRLYESDAVNANRTVGEAFAMSKADMISQCASNGSERWIQFGLNFLGDPALALYPRDPSSYLAAPAGLTASDVTSTTFTASWRGVENAEAYEVDLRIGSTSVEGYPVNVGNVTTYTLTDVTPNTNYTVRVRAVDSEKQSNWTPAVNVLTNYVPVWAALPQNVSIYNDGSYDLAISNYVTGRPAPVVTMTASDSEGAVFENGNFHFSSVETGTFNFTFKASNAEGETDATLTVTVTLPPVTVPTLAIAEPDITSVSAPVSWIPCDNVTEYTLQIATDDVFSDPFVGNVTLFSNTTSEATAPEGWTYNIYNFNATNSYLSLVSGNYVITKAFDVSDFVDLELSLYMRTYNGSKQPNITVEYTTDDGATWSALGTLAAKNSTMAQRTLDLSSIAGKGTIRLRIASTSTSESTGVAIKNITVTGTESTEGSLVFAGTVTGTTFNFTSLRPSTTYYVRVKGEAGWSDVISFTTAGPVSGDGNCDGFVSITDAVAVVNFILGNPSAGFNFVAADVNGDGKVTITDAVAVVNIILEESAAAPRMEQEDEDDEESSVEPE